MVDIQNESERSDVNGSESDPDWSDTQTKNQKSKGKAPAKEKIINPQNSGSVSQFNINLRLTIICRKKAQSATLH